MILSFLRDAVCLFSILRHNSASLNDKHKKTLKLKEMDEMKGHFNFVPSFISLFPQGSLKIQHVCHIFSVKLLVQPGVSYIKGK